MARRKTLNEGKRTDAFSLRIEPKLRFALELAAAKERRTLSSMIELAVDQLLRRTVVTANAEGEAKTAMQVADEVWDGDEIRRLLFLSARYPALLTTEQQRLRNLIVHLHGVLPEAAAAGTSLSIPVILRRLNWVELQRDLDTLKKIASGELPETALPVADVPHRSAPQARRRESRKKNA